MVKILHISDLHFVKDAADSNMREVLKNEAREAVAGLPQGSKLLVVTGDFHNYNTAGYGEALKFLNELIVAMDLDRTQDVFVVPGNHDVGNKDDMSKCFPGDEDWSMRMEMAVTKLRSSWPSDKADAKRTMPENYLRWRMESYRPYCVRLLRLGFRGFRPGFPEKSAGQLSHFGVLFFQKMPSYCLNLCQIVTEQGKRPFRVLRRKEYLTHVVCKELNIFGYDADVTKLALLTFTVVHTVLNSEPHGTIFTN